MAARSRRCISPMAVDMAIGKHTSQRGSSSGQKAKMDFLWWVAVEFLHLQFWTSACCRREDCDGDSLAEDDGAGGGSDNGAGDDVDAVLCRAVPCCPPVLQVVRGLSGSCRGGDTGSTLFLGYKMKQKSASSGTNSLSRAENLGLGQLYAHLASSAART